MNIIEIRKELEGVLKYIDKRCGSKEALPDHEIRRREPILWEQAILYKIETP